MKIVLCALLLVLTGLHLVAEDGHDLWLRSKNTGSVTVVCAKNSPTLTIAKNELKNNWQGKSGTSVTLTFTKDKAIKMMVSS